MLTKEQFSEMVSNLTDTSVDVNTQADIMAHLMDDYNTRLDLITKKEEEVKSLNKAKGELLQRVGSTISFEEKIKSPEEIEKEKVEDIKTRLSKRSYQ